MSVSLLKAYTLFPARALYNGDAALPTPSVMATDGGRTARAPSIIIGLPKNIRQVLRTLTYKLAATGTSSRAGSAASTSRSWAESSCRQFFVKLKHVRRLAAGYDKTRPLPSGNRLTPLNTPRLPISSSPPSSIQPRFFVSCMETTAHEPTHRKIRM